MREEEKEISKELTMDLENWEKEFDELVESNPSYGDHKYFVRQALSSQLKEVLGVIERIPRKKVKTDGSRMWIDFGNTKIKDVEEMVENGENNGYNDALDDLKAEIEKLV